MDLERLKQNLRLRSGRSKKTVKAKPLRQSEKGRPAPTKPAGDEDNVKARSLEDSHQVQTEEPRGRQLPRHNWTRTEDGLPPARPILQHATTQTDVENRLTNSSTRYGGSAIDLPQHPIPSSDTPPPLHRNTTEPQTLYASLATMEATDFDLRPRARKAGRLPSIEAVSQLLFSPGHLNSLLHDPQSLARFSAFLAKYKPEYQPTILRYLESQKAVKAVEYANAVAAGMTPNDSESGVDGQATRTPSVAATLDEAFHATSQSSFETLVGSALTMYITYSLVKLVTECIVSEITGKQMPIMRDLVGGLSESFCITDPNQDDDPIIYASEEFYRLTGYGPDDVIGQNCRFLQGRKTGKQAPSRLRECIDKGDETCETLLNYRRDGRAFINLLMIAPLHDNKGKVKYYIGAQVDVSGLVEGGRGLPTFERYLGSLESRSRLSNNGESSDSFRNPKALDKLRELSEMFDLEECAVVQSHSRSSSVSRDDDQMSTGSTERRKPGRRILVESDQSDHTSETSGESESNWNLGHKGPHGPSGKLPGVYDTYLLIRPAPSLRTIFVSPKLQRSGNLIQAPFLSHVAAPASTLAGLKQSFASGTPVSAKIHLMNEPGGGPDGVKTSPGTKHQDGKYGRACWISATPLLGSDDEVGVWMVVVIEKSKVRRAIGRTGSRQAQPDTNSTKNRFETEQSTRMDLPQKSPQFQHPAAPQLPPEEMPIKPKRLDNLSDPVENGESPQSEARSSQLKPGRSDAVDASKEVPEAPHPAHQVPPIEAGTDEGLVQAAPAQDSSSPVLEDSPVSKRGLNAPFSTSMTVMSSQSLSERTLPDGGPSEVVVRSDDEPENTRSLSNESLGSDVSHPDRLAEPEKTVKVSQPQSEETTTASHNTYNTSEVSENDVSQLPQSSSPSSSAQHDKRILAAGEPSREAESTDSSSDEEFVQLKELQEENPPKNRVQIQPDSDEEHVFVSERISHQDEHTDNFSDQEFVQLKERQDQATRTERVHIQADSEDDEVAQPMKSGDDKLDSAPEINKDRSSSEEADLSNNLVAVDPEPVSANAKETQARELHGQDGEQAGNSEATPEDGGGELPPEEIPRATKQKDSGVIDGHGTYMAESRISATDLSSSTSESGPLNSQDETHSQNSNDSTSRQSPTLKSGPLDLHVEGHGEEITSPNSHLQEFPEETESEAKTPPTPALDQPQVSADENVSQGHDDDVALEDKNLSSENSEVDAKSDLREPTSERLSTDSISSEEPTETGEVVTGGTLDGLQAIQASIKAMLRPETLSMESDEEAEAQLHNSAKDRSAFNRGHIPTGRKYTPPPTIPASMRTDAESPNSTYEPDSDGEIEWDYEDMTAAGIEGDSRSPTRRLYMDYLRHPGSRQRPSHDLGSILSRRTTADEFADGKTRDHFEEVDCAMSPYSVD